MSDETKEDQRDTRNLFQRLRDARLEIGPIAKTQPQGMRYKVDNYDHIVAAVEPILLKHGIIWTANVVEFQEEILELETLNKKTGELVMETISRCKVKMGIAIFNADEPNDNACTHHWGYGDGNDDKGPGKAETYATKSGLKKMLGLQSGDDPDQQAGDHAPRRKPNPKAGQVKTSNATRIKSIAEMIDAGDMEASKATIKAWLTEQNKGEVFATPGDIPKPLLDACEDHFTPQEDKS